MDTPLDAHFRDRISAMRPELVEGLRPARTCGIGSGGCSRRRRRVDILTSSPGSCRSKGRGFYTIGSSGHESNALVAMALRPTDPALLHYRSGRSTSPGRSRCRAPTPVRDVLQGLMALADEPIAGGRHKVFGHPDLGSSRRPRPSPRICRGRSGPWRYSARTGSACRLPVAGGRRGRLLVR